MPVYRVTDPDTGQKLRITGPAPPTEQELVEIFGGVSKNPDSYPTAKKAATIEDAVPREKKSVGGFIGNIASDAKDIASGVASMVMHPIDTATGIGNLAIGGSAALQKKLGLLDRDVPVEGEAAARQLAAPFVKAVRNPAGIPGQLVEYGYEKPISALASLSGATGLAGKTAQASGASRLANAMKSTSQATNPLNIAGSAGTAVAGGLNKLRVPEKLYGSAVKLPLTEKWTKAIGPEQASIRKNAISAGLEHEIMPTEYGVKKLTNIEKEVRGVIDTLIDENSLQMEGVRAKDIVSNGLDGAYKKAAASSNPVGAKALVKKLGKKFIAHGENISLSKLQDIKKQLYKEVSYASQETKGLHGGLVSTAKKGLAHEAMVVLEGQFPELKALNKKDAALISLRNGLERTVGRIENQDMVGLGAKVLLPEKWALAAVEATIGHPVIKALLAVALKKAGKKAATPYNKSTAAILTSKLKAPPAQSAEPIEAISVPRSELLIEPEMEE